MWNADEKCPHNHDDLAAKIKQEILTELKKELTSFIEAKFWELEL